MAGNLSILQHPSFSDFSPLDWRGRTPLHYAVSFGKSDCAIFLINEKGADPNHRDKFGYNSLHVAAESGNLSIISFLLEKGAEIVSERNGFEPFLIAFQRNKMNIFQFFLEKSPEIHRWQRRGATLYHMAAQIGLSEAIPILAGFGDLDVNGYDVAGYAPVHYAVRNGKCDVLRKLIGLHEFDANRETQNHVTAFEIAIESGDIEVIKWFLKTLPELREWRNSSQSTSLHVAAESGRKAVVRFFLDMGVERTVENSDGKTAAQLAAGTEAAEIRMLIEDYETIKNEAKHHKHRKSCIVT
jgi:ankyrin repeat protein